MTATTFRQAFDAHRPTLEAQADRRIRAVFARAVERHGPQLRGITADWDLAHVYDNTLRFVLSCSDSSSRDWAYTLDEAKLAAWVACWAEAQLDGAAVKLDAKIGDLTEINVVRGDGCWFVVTGTHPNGSKVTVKQDQILNVSSRGTLFNQWPAHIYVNGHKVSEAAYKRIAA